MSSDYVARLRKELRARVEAHVRPTFRHDGDPDPHPDEAALVDRLTDDVILPYELRLRAALAELERLRAERGELRTEWGTRWEGHERVGSFGYGPDAEESARSVMHPRDVLVTRLVGVWREAVSAPQQPERDHCPCDCPSWGTDGCGCTDPCPCKPCGFCDARLDEQQLERGGAE